MQNGLPGTLGRHVCHAIFCRRLRVPSRWSSSLPCTGFRSRRQHRHHSATATNYNAPAIEDDGPISVVVRQHSRQGAEEQLIAHDSEQLWSDLVNERDAVKLTGLFREANESSLDVPMPILRKVIDRPYLPPAALHQLMQYLNKRHSDTKPSIKELLQWYKRLLYHARQVSPESMDTATSLFLGWAPAASIEMGTSQHTAIRAVQRRTELLNSAMEELGDAPKIRPYASSIMQEGLLFRLLQYMAEHDPPLHVGRNGYRAVVRVQLRLPKTETEQHWASLKALSWPPWKRDRNAIDSELPPEYGRSNARSTLIKQASAGYPEDAWDGAASVYAGQETDGTPTIQTRRDMLRSYEDKLAVSTLWAARITATRTIQEAWMMWLQYRDIVGHNQHNDVTLAILMRLHQEEIGLRSSGLPGDGNEIHRPPASVHLHTYTRSAPPSTHSFFETVFEERETAGLRMSTVLAAYFVANANTFQQAHEYLDRVSRWYHVDGSLLVGHGASRGLGDHQADTMRSPTRLLVAAIIALCRFVHVPGGQHIPDSGLHCLWRHETAGLKQFEVNSSHKFARAVWLTQKLPPKHQALPWRAILRVLNDSPNNVRMQYLSKGVADLTSDRSNAFPDLTAAERTRFRYDLLTVQAYDLTLQVTKLIKKSIPLTIHMLEEVTTMTAHCAWSCSTVLAKAVEPERGKALTAVFESSKLMPIIETILASRPERTMMQLFEQAAGLTQTAVAGTKDLAADDLMIDESSGELHYSPGSFLTALDASEETETAIASNLSISAAHFHQWVRALGLLGKHEDLLDLLQRISDNTIGVFHDTSPRAARILRSAVVAVQVFLERPYLEAGQLRDLAVSESKAGRLYAKLCERAAPEMVEKAKMLLLARFGEDTGSWPSAEESAEYCELGHLGTMRRPGVT